MASKKSNRAVQKSIRVDQATDKKIEEISKELNITQAEFINICINIGINFYETGTDD